MFNFKKTNIFKIISDSDRECKDKNLAQFREKLFGRDQLDLAKLSYNFALSAILYDAEVDEATSVEDRTTFSVLRHARADRVPENCGGVPLSHWL